MRADRLVSLVLLLRQRGRMTADVLAAELEVSTRTVLRDIDALSSAGVPVYADRGRYGGFTLLPGFRTELTGLNHDEALALLAAASSRGEQVFGLGSALASAMRKVVDALPEGQRGSLDEASRRFLIEPEIDLLSRRAATDQIDREVLRSVRRAVLDGRKVRFDYAAPHAPIRTRIVDPIGLVTVRDRTYLLATVDGADRTYRLSRMSNAAVLDELAQRPPDVDLDALWAERAAQFLSDRSLTVTVRVHAAQRDELVGRARSGRVIDDPSPAPTADSAEVATHRTVLIELAFDDLEHAVWAIWQSGLDAEVLGPESVRHELAERAARLKRLYRDAPS